MSCLEHTRCPAWNTRDVLLGTHEMSCVEHTRCPAWNTRDVLRGTHEMSCLERTRCLAWNTRDVLFGTQEMTTKRAKYSVSQVKRISISDLHSPVPYPFVVRMMDLRYRVITAAVGRFDRSRGRSIESIGSVDSVILWIFRFFGAVGELEICLV